MQFFAIIIPALLAALAVATPLEDSEMLMRRDCQGSLVGAKAACPTGLFQVSLLTLISRGKEKGTTC
jgi:hypothetical protein